VKVILGMFSDSVRDSCVGLPRLYETASWRLGEGLQDGIRCVPRGAHSKKHTLL
jgi:hypothetical protein